MNHANHVQYSQRIRHNKSATSLHTWQLLTMFVAFGHGDNLRAPGKKLWALEFMSFPAQNGSRFQWIEVGCTSFGDIPGGYVGPSNFPEFFFR